MKQEIKLTPHLLASFIKYKVSKKEKAPDLTIIQDFNEFLKSGYCEHGWKLYLDSSPTYEECIYCGKRKNNYEKE